MKLSLYRLFLPLALLFMSFGTATAQTNPAARAPRPDANDRGADQPAQTAPRREAVTPRREAVTPAPSSGPSTDPQPMTPRRPGPGSATASLPAEPDAEAPDEMINTLILSDESALQVLDLLEQMTGRIILRRQDISPAKINFNSRGPISKADAVLALESLLTLNGIMLTDMGGRFMKAVPATDVNRHVPEMIVGTTLNRPASQQIYAKLFHFDYLRAEQAGGTIIGPLLSQNSSFVPFPKSNALLVTDALINLQRIERILEEADRPQSIRESIQFVKLDYIQAREMQERIDNLIQGPLSSYLEGSTSVTADERTNQLILITHPGNLETILSIIESVDVDAAPLTSSEVFPLRQAKAEEVVPMIESIISGQKEGREEDAKIARENQNAGRRPPNPNNNADAPPAPDAPQPPTPATVTTGTTDVNSSLQFSNFVGLSADDRTNSIVAYGTQSDLRTLKELIDKIDIPLPQVRIEAIITEVTLTENQASGIEQLGFSFNGDDLIFGTEIPTTGGDDDQSQVPNDAGGIFGSGFSLIGDTTGVFSAVLRASESDGNVRILSVPNVVVSHNEEGIINVSESRPIITGSTSSLQDNSTNVRSNVEFRDIGIQLTVTPLIGADGTVQMQIEQTVDNVAGNITIDGNPQPIIGRREATSTITVDSGQLIVLGGLQENRKSDSNSYFPFFGRLPGLNKIFGGESTDYTRTELVIFIRPTVLTSQAERQKMTLETIRTTPETEAINTFLETGTTGRLYMEGSRFEEAEPEPTEEEEEEEEEEADNRRGERPFIRWGWDRDDY